MNDIQLLGLHAFLWVKKFSHLRLRWLKGASTRATLLSVWNLKRKASMVVALLLLEKNDNQTVRRGSYLNISIALYCNVLYPVLIFFHCDHGCCRRGQLRNWYCMKPQGYFGTVYDLRAHPPRCVCVHK
jgi:hypothetical protein